MLTTELHHLFVSLLPVSVWEVRRPTAAAPESGMFGCLLDRALKLLNSSGPLMFYLLHEALSAFRRMSGLYYHGDELL